MKKIKVIEKWEHQYDYYLKKADAYKAEVDELDIEKDWGKYKQKRIYMENLYYLCAIISTMIKDVKGIDEN